MLWQPINNETCEVCQCSRLIKNSFQVSEKYSDVDADNSFSHSPVCSSYDHLDMDKENLHLGSPSKHDNDISLYGNSSPSTTRTRCASLLCNSSPKAYNSTRLSRQPMEEFDLNSQDSGYGTNFNDKEQKINFNFLQPKATSPNGKENSRSLFSSFSSGSMESMDDGFLELSYIESVDENTLLPPTFNSLVSGSMKNETPVNTNSNRIRPSFRRSISLKEESSSSTSPSVNRIRHCLFKCDKSESCEYRPIKRTDPPIDIVSPVQAKRYKCNEMIPNILKSSNSNSTTSTITTQTHPKIQRSLSANEATIMSALQRSSTDPDLIGDFSKPFCLPLVSGKHQDLKSISPSTLADLMRGKYDSAVNSYKVVDCRYPYEYEGGHIRNASNFYTKEQIMYELVENKCKINCTDNTKRNILVFHCEFSSERGPNLSRFLRNIDRTRNNDSYPSLDWPEIYLLDGGYKNFYEQYSDLCMPTAYKPMLDPAHESDLKHFRAKSKTWNADTRGRFSVRSSNLKRLGFV